MLACNDFQAGNISKWRRELVRRTLFKGPVRPVAFLVPARTETGQGTTGGRKKLPLQN